MRVQFRLFLAGFVCVLALSAFAGDVRVAPSQFDVGVEDFISIYGTNLLGTVRTVVVFDGLYEVEPSSADASQLLVFIPTPVMVTPAQHSLVVRSIDGGGVVRTHGPATFIVSEAVVEPGGPPILSLPENVIAEATSANGAIVRFAAAAFDGNGDVAVTCAPASGDAFRLGPTNVRCSATNAGGTASGSFLVFVADTVPPVVTVPADIVSDDRVVTFSATAADAIAGSLPVSCSPASGSTFAQGTTRVVCTAHDAFSNSARASFLVTVSGGPPALELPDDITEEATAPTGAVVTFTATAPDGSP
ncbi:MAG TPA: HYR domain-containing protein, partial [Thermoanaerobaculia bacterium]|nr:HYR domain-containing protein [Thermoanaerobaculia bacterium]